MRRKIIMTLALILAGVSQGWAQNFIYEGIKYNVTSTTDKTVEVTKNPGVSGAIIIPASVTYSSKTYTVTTIGSHAFNGCSSLRSVTIPESVTSIAGSAFHGCSTLASITLPENLTTIGNWAFRGCSSLTSITIPDGVTAIGICTF